MNRIDACFADSASPKAFSQLAWDVSKAQTRLTNEEIESLVVLLNRKGEDFRNPKEAWWIFLRQPVIDNRLLRIADEAISSYPALATCSGYESGIDLKLQYLLEHGNLSTAFIDNLAKIPIGRIKTVIAEYLITKKEIDGGFRLLIEALPLAYDAMDHATFDHIGFPLGEISTPERRNQLQLWLDEAKRDGKPESTIESLEYALEAMG